MAPAPSSSHPGSNPGLVTFKDRWGTARSVLTYARFTASPNSAGSYRPARHGRHKKFADFVVAHLPGTMFSWLGRMAYRHIG